MLAFCTKHHFSTFQQLKTMEASLNMSVNVTLPTEDLQCDLEQLERTHTALTEDFQALESQHQDLEVDYNLLSDKYDELLSEHTLLHAVHKRVKRSFADLEDDYAETFTELTELKEEHAELLRMYHELQDKAKPELNVNVFLSKYNKRPRPSQ